MLPTSPVIPNYFSPFELRCHCGLGSCQAKPMDPAFMDRYNAFRHEWGRPIVVTSARRCMYWNLRVGGKPGSFHPPGRAIDARCEPEDQEAFVECAAKFGLVGVGRGKTFVHLDDGPAREWRY